MKSEAEIRKAIAHLEQAKIGAERIGSPAHYHVFAAIQDALQWCAGDANTFQELMDECDQIDGRHDRAAVN